MRRSNPGASIESPVCPKLWGCNNEPQELMVGQDTVTTGLGTAIFIALVILAVSIFQGLRIVQLPRINQITFTVIVSLSFIGLVFLTAALLAVIPESSERVQTLLFTILGTSLVSLLIFLLAIFTDQVQFLFYNPVQEATAHLESLLGEEADRLHIKIRNVTLRASQLTRPPSQLYEIRAMVQIRGSYEIWCPQSQQWLVKKWGGLHYPESNVSMLISRIGERWLIGDVTKINGKWIVVPSGSHIFGSWGYTNDYDPISDMRETLHRCIITQQRPHQGMKDAQLDSPLVAC